MTTKIELKSMRFYAYHGVDPQETRVGNWFIVDLMVTVDLVQAIENDNLDSTVNYAEIYEVVKSEMNVPSKLILHLEAMCKVQQCYWKIKRIYFKIKG